MCTKVDFAAWQAHNHQPMFQIHVIARVRALASLAYATRMCSATSLCRAAHFDDREHNNTLLVLAGPCAAEVLSRNAAGCCSK